MKIHLIIVCLLFFSNISISQSKIEKQNIFQKCIDLEELQKHFEDDNEKHLIIFENEIISSEIKLFKFGRGVEILSGQELFFEGLEADISFTYFEFNECSGSVSFNYPVANKKIEVIFKKTEGLWNVKRNKISNIK